MITALHIGSRVRVDEFFGLIVGFVLQTSEGSPSIEAQARIIILVRLDGSEYTIRVNPQSAGFELLDKRPIQFAVAFDLYKRANDVYHAQRSDDPLVYEQGSTPDEAIGRLAQRVPEIAILDHTSPYGDPIRLMPRPKPTDRDTFGVGDTVEYRTAMQELQQALIVERNYETHRWGGTVTRGSSPPVYVTGRNVDIVRIVKKADSSSEEDTDDSSSD